MRIWRIRGQNETQYNDHNECVGIGYLPAVGSCCVFHPSGNAVVVGMMNAEFCVLEWDHDLLNLEKIQTVKMRVTCRKYVGPPRNRSKKKMTGSKDFEHNYILKHLSIHTLYCS